MRINRSRRFLLTGTAVIAALVAASLALHPPLLIYNRTPSMPIGFYVYRGGSIRRGDIVAFVLPIAAYSYAHRRGESTHILLLKHVLAIGGDFVSTLNGQLRINGVFVGPIATVDSAGRPLPHWLAARKLSADELLVGSTITRSFDSRYFGPIHVNQVVGIYRKLCGGASPLSSAASPVLGSTPSSFLPSSANLKSHKISNTNPYSMQGKIKGGYQPGWERIAAQGVAADSLRDSLYTNHISHNHSSTYRYQDQNPGVNP